MQQLFDQLLQKRPKPKLQLKLLCKNFNLNMQISALFILEVINIGIALIFLGLFIYRLNHLRHFSQTDKYLNYYPKVRIVFALIYVILSISLLSYNIAVHEYQNQNQKYLFAGGGGEVINSLILLLQLAVLRQELKKERPYTSTHVIYFFYLVVISITRFSITLVDVVQNQTLQVVDLIIATCLMADSCIQLGYWVAKKQTLPQFENNNYFSFDQFRIQSHRHMISRNDRSGKIQQKSFQEGFPYIKSTVKIENGKFKIILQIFVSNNILPANFEQTDIQKIYSRPSQIKGKNVSRILRQSIDKSYRNTQNYSKTSLHLEIISEHFYNLQQVKQLYILCGRFPLTNQIIFSELPLRQIAKYTQVFLNEVFQQRRHYLPFLLKYFQIDEQFLQIYEQKNKHLQQQIIVSDYQTEFQNKNASTMDKNAPYLSIQIYKQLWIEDHYEFYMKICVKENTQISYPMRRYSEFQDFHDRLKMILADKTKNNNFAYQLPQLPKKHLFSWDQEKIRHRRVQLQVYLRKLCNDHELMQIVQFRDIILRFLNLYNKIFHINPVFERDFYENVHIIKGNISKGLINNDYVTFYQLKLFRQGIEIRSITKRFSDFVTLDEDLIRWMNNIQICYKNIVIPQKHLFKSQTHRHQKLRNYIQSIINLKQSFEIYPLNVFLNINGNTELSDDTFYSAISFVKSRQGRLRDEAEIERNRENNTSSSGNQHRGTLGEYQMENTDGKRMSALIDELGFDHIS